MVGGWRISSPRGRRVAVFEPRGRREAVFEPEG